MKKSKSFLRAQNLVLQDKFGFCQDAFAADLKNFLTNYFVFEGLKLDVVEGVQNKLVICVNVSGIKKSRSI